MLKLNKLEKLKIRSYTDKTRTSLVNTFTVMFNPEAYALKLNNNYRQEASINKKASSEAKRTYNDLGHLTLNLILDGTGLTEPVVNGNLTAVKSVPQQISELIETTYTDRNPNAEPRYLVISWGAGSENGLQFPCRLKSMELKYTLFAREGTPLRANITATFVADEDIALVIAKMSESTATDTTTADTINEDDNIVLKTAEVYNRPDKYIEVAKANRLNNFRKLNPGQTLVFPPVK